jgi:hypothetical protein
MYIFDTAIKFPHSEYGGMYVVIASTIEEVIDVTIEYNCDEKQFGIKDRLKTLKRYKRYKLDKYQKPKVITSFMT